MQLSFPDSSYQASIAAVQAQAAIFTVPTEIG